MRQTSSQSSLTAHHEAGHAVAAYLLGRAFTRVSIEANEETVGRCSFRAPGEWFRPHERLDTRTRARLEERIIISLAGPHAEAMFSGRFDDDAAAEDIARASELADYMSNNDPDESQAYLEWLGYRTRRLTEREVFWPAVDALAHGLLGAGEIPYRRARLIIEAAQVLSTSNA